MAPPRPTRPVAVRIAARSTRPSTIASDGESPSPVSRKRRSSAGSSAVAGERLGGGLGALEADRATLQPVRGHRIEGPRPSVGTDGAAEQLAPQIQVRAASYDVGAEVERADVGLGHLRAAQPQRSVAVGVGQRFSPQIGLDLTAHSARWARTVQPGGIEVAHLAVQPVHGRGAATDDGASLRAR